MLMIALQGYKVGPAGIRKRRKATVKKRRNTAPGFKALDPTVSVMEQVVSRYWNL